MRCFPVELLRKKALIANLHVLLPKVIMRRRFACYWRTVEHLFFIQIFSTAFSWSHMCAFLVCVRMCERVCRCACLCTEHGMCLRFIFNTWICMLNSWNFKWWERKSFSGLEHTFSWKLKRVDAYGQKFMFNNVFTSTHTNAHTWHTYAQMPFKLSYQWQPHEHNTQTDRAEWASPFNVLV